MGNVCNSCPFLQSYIEFEQTVNALQGFADDQSMSSRANSLVKGGQQPAATSRPQSQIGAVVNPPAPPPPAQTNKSPEVRPVKRTESIYDMASTPENVTMLQSLGSFNVEGMLAACAPCIISMFFVHRG